MYTNIQPCDLEYILKWQRLQVFLFQNEDLLDYYLNDEDFKKKYEKMTECFSKNVVYNDNYKMYEINRTPYYLLKGVDLEMEEDQEQYKFNYVQDKRERDNEQNYALDIVTYLWTKYDEWIVKKDLSEIEVVENVYMLSGKNKNSAIEISRSTYRGRVRR